MNANARQLLRWIRSSIAIVIAGLVVSGLTAFPLVPEVAVLHRWLTLHSSPTPLTAWIAKVHQALTVVDSNFPFLAYGTDWLAFGHFVIALFFIGAFVDPLRNVWVIRAGQLACMLVIPIALICGEIRGIPWWWRGIDSALGVFGFLPLWVAERLIQRLATADRIARSQPGIS